MNSQEALAYWFSTATRLQARGEARPDSDLDILIELDPDVQLDVFGYVGLKMCLEGLFPGSVDAVDREALKPHVRPAAESTAIYVF